MSLYLQNLDHLQFFSSHFGHVVDLSHSFTYFLFLLKYFFILYNLTTIGLRKGEKTLRKN
jgi:hypothetical protein